MTLKEFANKYQIPYNVVYEASYKVQPISTVRRDRDFPEKQLFIETRCVIKNKIDRHRDIARKQAEMLDRLRGICP